MTDTNMHTAHDVLADERRHGEALEPTADDYLPGAVTLELEGGVRFCVSDEYDAWEIGEGAVHVGYVWAIYADAESARELDYLEHDGGLTGRELLDALDRARTLARHRS